MTPADREHMRRQARAALERTRALTAEREARLAAEAEQENTVAHLRGVPHHHDGPRLPPSLPLRVLAVFILLWGVLFLAFYFHAIAGGAR
jgi:hypothetical protein